ncbi:MAG: hypothetical protein E4H00_02555 [Myxococcales bacterium]|nr:MAG: hypothetical protein E4H00_02555 [Myxococcales bacterium]
MPARGMVRARFSLPAYSCCRTKGGHENPGRVTLGEAAGRAVRIANGGCDSPVSRWRTWSTLSSSACTLTTRVPHRCWRQMVLSIHAHGHPRSVAQWVSVLLLNALVTKPICVFVYWLSHCKNRTRFHERRKLESTLHEARRQGRPILFASNHLSMFDDPIVPMALYRLGPKALGELVCLSLLSIAAFVSGLSTPSGMFFGATAFAFAVWASAFGARKLWWSMGDLANFTTSAGLEARLSGNGQQRLGPIKRRALAMAGWLLRGLMTSPVVKTVFVDRRGGDDAQRMRARSLALAVEIAAEGEPLWVFVEGGRSRNPDEIQPARRGIGELVTELGRRNRVPLVVGVHHRGLEEVIPIGAQKFLDLRSHVLDVRWCVLEFPPEQDDPQGIADAVRRGLVALQADWRQAQVGA